jgi:hypothetical protein
MSMREQCVRAAVGRFTCHRFENGENVAAAPATCKRTLGALT